MNKRWYSKNADSSSEIRKEFMGRIMCSKNMVQKRLIDDIISTVNAFLEGKISFSRNWKNWIAIIDHKTCKTCVRNHGKIYNMAEYIEAQPPIHINCRCSVIQVLAITAGYATQDGVSGVDRWLMQYQKLPDHYITKEQAYHLGWIPKDGNLYDVAPGKVIGGDIYENRNGHLPMEDGRIWYEADINYSDGYRALHRILYSNDGLIFVTYDHYKTFVEIV
jgi:SPP1 gp7 family putative phage head morphogenesis protein